MSKRVVQLLPAAHAGDATGGAALSLAEALRNAGYTAAVHALTIDEALRGKVGSIDELSAAGPDDLTILHFAIPSPLSELLQKRDGRRAIVYHNLTPPDLLLPYCPEIAELTAKGRVELGELAASGRVDSAIGVSEFNRRDLEQVGFAGTRTLPLSLDLSLYNVYSDPVIDAQEPDGRKTFLTVGRIAPNKRLETLVRAAAYYVQHVDPNAQFVVVGGSRGLEAYSDALAELAGELGVDRNVRWVGRVSHRDLVAWYRAADAYLCTSAHEGFCAPLLEAMHFGVPILARDAAAIPETLANAGVLFSSDDPAELAEAMHALVIDTELRELLTARGQARVRDFAPERVARVWLDWVIDMVGSP